MHDDDRIVAVFSGGGTGGHLYPALAIADALVDARPDVRTVFVGAERGLEATVLPARDQEHVLLPVRGLDRARPWTNAGVLWDLARSVTRLATLFRRLRPAVVVVTGGYAGAPAGMVAVPLGIPIVLQEANSHPGVTNRRLASRARIIHLAFPEARDLLPPRARPRAVVSGNPIRPPRPIDRGVARATFGLRRDGTVALAVGGSQGARALNELLLDGIARVEAGVLGRPAGLELLWATGMRNFEEVTARLEEIGRPPWVHAVEYIHRMPEALAAADLAISRAGALTTSEFLAWGIPALLIPLPSAAADHQSKNARALAAAGAALHLPEDGLLADTLWEAVTQLASDPERRSQIAVRARARGRPEAAADIARSVEQLLPPAAETPPLGSVAPDGGDGT